MAIAVFIFCALLLGAIFDFYGMFWWWDVLLRGSSAIGFAKVIFLFVYSMSEGDKNAAPAWAIAFVSNCFAATIGVIREMFEYATDQTFGFDKQKSGLQDTIRDLTDDSLGPRSKLRPAFVI